MKIKKALKRLNKVETLLTNVIDQCPPSARGLRELLDSAKVSVVRAKGVVNARAARNVKKPPARAAEATQSRLSEEGRARISLAAKKRWAELRRKNASAAKTA
jgi:hypothetical protein